MKLFNVLYTADSEWVHRLRRAIDMKNQDINVHVVDVQSKAYQNYSALRHLSSNIQRVLTYNFYCIHPRLSVCL